LAEPTDQSGFTIGTITAGRGTRAEGVLPVSHRLDGTVFGIPVVIVHGAEPGPTLLVDGAMHGDELEGMLAIQQVCRDVDPAALRGTLVGVPAVNYAALEALQRSTPRRMLSDAKSLDLNRVFPGDPHGTGTERVAAVYATTVLQRADYYITFHSGGNAFAGPPKVLYDDLGDELGSRNAELARAFGWQVLWANKGGYFFNGASTGQTQPRGVPSIVPEHGGSDRMPGRLAEHVGNCVRGIYNVLYHLEMLDGQPTLPQRWHSFVDDTHIHVEHDGILIFEDWVELSGVVKQGQRYARLYDIFGRVLDELTAPWTGQFVLLRTYPVVQSGDWACSITNGTDVDQEAGTNG
jgi:predicted deacylase